MSIDNRTNIYYTIVSCASNFCKDYQTNKTVVPFGLYYCKQDKLLVCAYINKAVTSSDGITWNPIVQFNSTGDVISSRIYYSKKYNTYIMITRSAGVLYISYDRCNSWTRINFTLSLELGNQSSSDMYSIVYIDHLDMFLLTDYQLFTMFMSRDLYHWVNVWAAPIKDCDFLLAYAEGINRLYLMQNRTLTTVQF